MLIVDTATAVANSVEVELVPMLKVAEFPQVFMQPSFEGLPMGVNTDGGMEIPGGATPKRSPALYKRLYVN